MSKEQLMNQEERSFQEYLGKIHGAYTSEKLSYFEHNLEVTMGQGMGLDHRMPRRVALAPGHRLAHTNLVFADVEAAVASARDVRHSPACHRHPASSERRGMGREGCS